MWHTYHLSWLDIGAVLRIAHVSKARAIVEIGVECGGLAAQLAAYCVGTKTRYIGGDIRIDALDPTIDQATILHANAHEPNTIQRIDQLAGQSTLPDHAVYLRRWRQAERTGIVRAVRAAGGCHDRPRLPP